MLNKLWKLFSNANSACSRFTYQTSTIRISHTIVIESAILTDTRVIFSHTNKLASKTVVAVVLADLRQLQQGVDMEGTFSEKSNQVVGI